MHSLLSGGAPLHTALPNARPMSVVAVLVDAGYITCVKRAVAPCQGVADVHVTYCVGRPQVRLDIHCQPSHADDVVARIDACVRKGEIGRLAHFVVSAARRRA